MRFLTLLLVYASTAFSTFSFMTHFMSLENFLPYEYALYAGAGSALLALIFGFLLAKKPRAVEEDFDEEEEPQPVKAAVKEEKPEPEPEPEKEPVVEESKEPELTTEDILRENITPVTVEPLKKPDLSFINDTTTVINTIADNDPFETPEKPVKLEARKPMVELISPLGPRTITPPVEEKPELVEEPEEEPQPQMPEEETDLFDTAAYQHLADELEPQTDSTEQIMSQDTNAEKSLSNTQETYISGSRVSYIDETGMPQFRVTQQYKPVSDDGSYEEVSFAETKEDRISDILNKVITVLVIALVLVGLYLLYVKFFG